MLSDFDMIKSVDVNQQSFFELEVSHISDLTFVPSLVTEKQKCLELSDHYEKLLYHKLYKSRT